MEALLRSLDTAQLILVAAVAAIVALGVLPLILRRRTRARRPKLSVVQNGRFRQAFPRPRRRRFRLRTFRALVANPLWLVALAALLGIAFKLQPNLLGQAIPLSGPVTHVRDGDTIEVNGTPIRLNGLNCDELGSPLGDQAKSAMQTLIAGERLSCSLNGDRTFDRRVGRCQLDDGRDIGAVLIEAGACGRCSRHDPLRKYAAAASEAGPFPGDYPSYCWWPW